MNNTKRAAVEGAILNWVEFPNVQQASFSRGCTFRCTEAQWPYEKIVDFMLVDNPNSPSSFSVLVCSGYKAGIMLNNLPAEALSAENLNGISVGWLRTNWNKWIYEKCNPNNLLVIENYPANMSLIGSMPSESRDIDI
ncbi:hypothetical protein GN316_18525 [Xylophilus sp. Kf1]|nr:hypothetical protein [Xylophilus sp. Kf1]